MRSRLVRQLLKSPAYSQINDYEEFLALCFWAPVRSSGRRKKQTIQKGQFSLGLRTTTSVFGHDPVPGLGVGGQFRLQILDYIDTEWFADYITMDLKGARIKK